MERYTRYNIMWWKFVSDLRQGGGFLPGTPASSINKTEHHDITEIFSKVTLKHHTPLQIIPGGIISLMYMYDNHSIYILQVNYGRSRRIKSRCFQYI